MWKGLSRARRRSSVIAVSAGVMAIGVALSGCAADPAAGGASNSLERIQEAGVLNVGSCLALPPWGSIGSNGEPEGFDIDTSSQLADFLGVDLKTTEVTAAARVPSLETSQVDVISCTFTITAERQAQVDFSNPMVAAGVSLVVLQGSDITSVDDLSGRTVAVSKGGTASQLMATANPDAVLQPYDSYAAALLALTSGQADALVEGADAVSTAAAADANLKIVVDGDVAPRTYYAFGVKKGDKELLEKINEFVEQFHSSGEDVKLFTQWLGFAPTYQFVDLPVTEVLK